MLAAVLFTTLTVSSVGFAQEGGSIRFTLEPARDGRVQLGFRSASAGNTNHWSTSFAANELSGLDLARLQSAGGPVRFTVVREPGRIDCSGQANRGTATGECGFAPDPAFASLLAAEGYPRPSQQDYYQMAVAGVGKDLIRALGSARYPRPSIDTLTALAAVGVTGGYVRDLARRGYRPDSVDDLVEFGALDISPEFIDSFARAGYRNLDADALVQFKALGITADYVAGFARIGYPNLAADELVQLKALDVTPAFVDELRRAGMTGLTPDRLVQLRAVGLARRP